MHADLVLHDRPITSVFQLLGTKENAITFSLGWALAHSPALRSAVMTHVFPDDADLPIDRVRLQEHDRQQGITDVELLGPGVHVIIEAKRGWELPSKQQLARYASRFERPQRALVAMSECSAEYASLHIERRVAGVGVVHIGWRDLARMARIKHGSHAEKRLLEQLRRYLHRIVKMQNQESNMVYVVSLGGDRPSWSKLSWIEIVNERRRYFHHVGSKGWPKEPPNYIAFRYDGHLQTIHHIDAWKIITDVHTEMPELNPGPWEPHFLYTLGPPIVPPQPVKTWKIYPSGRVWAPLDLLLTSKTISEARDKTDQRGAVD